MRKGKETSTQRMGLGSQEMGSLLRLLRSHSLARSLVLGTCPPSATCYKGFPPLLRKTGLLHFSSCLPAEPLLKSQKGLASSLRSSLDSAPSPSPGTCRVFLSTSVLLGPGMRRRRRYWDYTPLSWASGLIGKPNISVQRWNLPMHTWKLCPARTNLEISRAVNAQFLQAEIV